MYDPARDAFKDHDEPPAAPKAASSEDREAPRQSPSQKRKHDSPPSEPPVKRKRESPSPSELNHKRKREGREGQSAPKRPREPSPPRRPSPPRKRPGAASRLTQAERDAVRERQRQREQERDKELAAAPTGRGNHEVVRQHYNAVPQRGREWRRTDSTIKGLRSYNNWVKSVLIQKFSPNDDFDPHGPYPQPKINVLDIGCGKGGDILKWQKTPQEVNLYVGVDPAEVSIEQAKERLRNTRGKRLRAEFITRDGYGEFIGDLPIVQDVLAGKWSSARDQESRHHQPGFDVVTMMFCMHYAYENETTARGMLGNVRHALRNGGRFIGVIPNSDVIRDNVEAYNEKKASSKKSPKPANGEANSIPPDKEHDSETSKEERTTNGVDGEKNDDVLEWGNSIYRVRFPRPPTEGAFRPPFGWKYNYHLEEAVEAPEYVVPWEAFRALAEEYNLQLQYRRPLLEVWNEEREHPVLGELSRRMDVKDPRTGELNLNDKEKEAVGFYHCFCFYKCNGMKTICPPDSGYLIYKHIASM